MSIEIIQIFESLKYFYIVYLLMIERCQAKFKEKKKLTVNSDFIILK